MDNFTSGFVPMVNKTAAAVGQTAPDNELVAFIIILVAVFVIVFVILLKILCDDGGSSDYYGCDWSYDDQRRLDAIARDVMISRASAKSVDPNDATGRGC